MLTLITACSGTDVDIGGYLGDSLDAGIADAHVDTATPPVGPVGTWELHLRASTATIEQRDGFYGQTPTQHTLGIRSVKLYRNASDTSPLTIFESEDHVDAGLGDGDDTIVARALTSKLTAGTFTMARVGITHTRYTVAATMHALGQNIGGSFRNLHVLSDGVTLDANVRDRGYFDFSFSSNGQPLGAQSGENGPLPAFATTSELRLDTSTRQAFFEFPVHLTLPNGAPDGTKVYFDVNTYQNFRWKDETAAGYTTGVFDCTPTSYEPVVSFGANSFSINIEFPSSTGGSQ